MAEKLSVDDILAIQDLIARYALYADEGAHDAVGELLAHADLYAQGALMVSRDARQIRDRFARTVRPEGVGRRHYTTNIIVERLGPDLASSASCFLWTESAPGGPPRMLMCGAYRDRFERVGGAWRFLERRIVTDGVPIDSSTSQEA